MPSPVRLILPVLAAAVLVAGCSSEPESQPSDTGGTAASPSPTSTCSFDTTVQGVTATMAAGATPTVSIAEGAKKPTKLVAEDLCLGTGQAARLGDVVMTNYTMAPFSTKQQLESSFETGQPLTMPLVPNTGAIEGYVLGVRGMKPGGYRLVLIPGKQAYGPTPPPGSPFEPNEAFAFVISLEAAQPLSSPAPS